MKFVTIQAAVIHVMIAFGLFWLPPMRVLADPPVGDRPTRQVRVSLRDHRVLVGFVDQRSDFETLWIRVERNGIELSSGVTWDLVQSVELDGESFSAAQFREIARQHASGSDRRIVSSRSARTPSPIPPTPIGWTSGREEQVQYVEVQARVANWDRDLEVDGIEVRILPRSADQRLVPVHGAFSAELMTRDQTADPRERTGPFPIREAWSQSMRVPDFSSPTGALYRLPFRQIRPDQNLQLQSFGNLTITLNTVGHGHFQAAAPVRLRTFNPLRDDILQYQQRHDEFHRYRGRHW